MFIALRTNEMDVLPPIIKGDKLPAQTIGSGTDEAKSVEELVARAETMAVWIENTMSKHLAKAIIGLYQQLKKDFYADAASSRSVRSTRTSR